MKTKYFLDTEFHEHTKKIGAFGFKKEVQTIELISIGIVCEDGRKYYAISKDFDIDAAWNNEWLRKNVLTSIYSDLLSKVGSYGKTYHYSLMQFNLKGMKNLLKWYGLSNKQIANDICVFIYGDDDSGSGMSAIEIASKYDVSDKTKEPEFYAYFADYDWVVFCWLFGRMIDLPKGFPMYCRDLKQMLDEKLGGKKMTYLPAVNGQDEIRSNEDIELSKKLKWAKQLSVYPTQQNEHSAIDDAEWNVKLYDFIQNKI